MNIRKLVGQLLLAVLSVCAMSIAAAADTVSHSIESAILADAGFEATRAFDVDLPLNYHASGIRYPVVYLLHGANGSVSDLTEAGPVAQKLTDTPVIVVRPGLARRGTGTSSDTRSEQLEQVLAHEILPFIDATYRTIASREGRAVAGFSMGGADAVYLGLDYPDLFSQIVSLAGGHSSASQVWAWARAHAGGHAYHLQPLGFWFWHGARDGLTNVPTPLMDLLQQVYWPYVYLADEGGHINYEGPLAESLAWLGKRLWSEVLSANGVRSITRTLRARAAAPLSDQVEIDVTRTESSLFVDLSALGRNETLPLVPDSNGRLVGLLQGTAPAGNGLYYLPVQRAGTNGEPEFVADLRLQVYPDEDVQIFGPAQLSQWAVETRSVTTGPDQIDGRDALGMTGTRWWDVILTPEIPRQLLGTEAIVLEFHPGLSPVPAGSTILRLYSEAGIVDLLPLIDLERSEWQSLEVSLEALGQLPEQALSYLRLQANLTGTCYLGEIRLKPASMPAATAAELYPPAARFVRGTEELALTVGGPSVLEVAIELAGPSEALSVPVGIDVTAVGRDEIVPLAVGNEGRRRAQVTVGSALANGYYQLPILQLTAPPQLLASYHLSVYPTHDVALYGDDATPGWEAVRFAQVDLAAAAPVYEGATSLAVDADGSPVIRWNADPPLPGFGYALHLAVHPGTVELNENQSLIVNLFGKSSFQSFRLNGRGVETPSLNLATARWQIIEIPVELPENDPITKIEVGGQFVTGRFYLDDVRLVASAPPPPVLTAVSERREQHSVPDGFALAANYPNPFNSQTVIGFSLPTPADVELVVFDLLGQRVATLVYGPRAAGHYNVHWDGRHDAGHALASGIYLYRLRAGDRLEARRLALVR